MKRRAFLATAIAAALTPIPRAQALVITGDPSRWFAVGDGEDYCAIWARSAEDARRYWAWTMGRTVAEECPTCGGYMCHAHNPDLDAPQPIADAREHAAWANIGPDRKPSNLEWLRVGYNVPCDHCQDDPTECYALCGEALCTDCLEVAKIQRIDALVGTLPNTPIQEPYRGFV